MNISRIDCTDAEVLLAGWLAGPDSRPGVEDGLEAGERRALMAHIDECEDCARLACQVALTDLDLAAPGQIESHSNGISLDEPTKEPIAWSGSPAIANEERNNVIAFNKSRKRRLLSRAGEIAALVAAAALIYVWTSQWRGSPDEEPSGGETILVGEGKEPAREVEFGAARPEAPDDLSSVSARELRVLRVSGEDRIEPDKATKAAIKRDGKTEIIAKIKMCLTKTGEVGTVDIVQSSGYDAYDRKITDKMLHWKFKPFMKDGRAVPVCTAITFIYRQS